MKEQYILLVEDNPDDVKLTLRALEKARISNKVQVVADGMEALDFHNGTGKYAGRDTRVLPQVVLLDLQLPGMNGIEVLRHIRENEKTKLLPVVILTTSSEERDMVEAYSFGANSYIRKPVDFNNFVEAVQQLGLYWLVLNTPPWEDK